MVKSILKAGERIDQLFSTDVKIIQNKDVFSYSIDSVLLSRFPKIPSRGLIVDLCSGNGAVGLCQHSHQSTDYRGRIARTFGKYGRAFNPAQSIRKPSSDD